MCDAASPLVGCMRIVMTEEQEAGDAEAVDGKCIPISIYVQVVGTDYTAVVIWYRNTLNLLQLSFYSSMATFPLHIHTPTTRVALFQNSLINYMTKRLNDNS